MNQLFEPTIDEQIREVERELLLRDRGRRISRGMADRQMDLMRAVLRTLQRVKAAAAFAEAQAAEQEKRV
jgi:hypothetical protein